jgi:hypothetical protein
VSGRAGVPPNAADADSKATSTQNLLDLLQHTAKLEARVKMFEAAEVDQRESLSREKDAREKADRALAAKQEVRRHITCARWLADVSILIATASILIG